MRLSVLDLAPIASGQTAGDALACTLDLARRADARGLHRYWVAEHHNAGALASASPEILIGLLARETSRIRVGAGGVMLTNHAPLRVAESFRVLHALFPGRIDLGLGRAAGTDPPTARALRGARAGGAEDFPAQLDELCGYLDERSGPRPGRGGPIVAIPMGVPRPDVWLLGSGDGGAAIAAERGLPLAFSHLMNPDEAAATVARYKADFRPSAHRAEPEALLAVAVLCAPTNEEAHALAACGELAWVRLRQGQRDLPFPSVAEARAHRYDDEEEALRRAVRGRGIVGDPPSVAQALRALARAAGVDEVMLSVGAHEHAVRARVYDLVADALDVPRPAPGGAAHGSTQQTQL